MNANMNAAVAIALEAATTDRVRYAPANVAYRATYEAHMGAAMGHGADEAEALESLADTLRFNYEHNNGKLV